MRKKLPIGIDGFEKIRTNDFYYADKTLFVHPAKTIWKNAEYEYAEVLF